MRVEGKGMGVEESGPIDARPKIPIMEVEPTPLPRRIPTMSRTYPNMEPTPLHGRVPKT